MVTFIHAADFHLDSPFRELTGEQAALRRKEQRNLLRRLADLAREKKADFVLLAGDLFDGANLYRETGEAMIAALGQMDCPVFIAPGNHDPMTSASPYRTLPWPENVHIFQKAKTTSFSILKIVSGKYSKFVSVTMLCSSKLLIDNEDCD